MFLHIGPRVPKKPLGTQFSKLLVKAAHGWSPEPLETIVY